MRRTLPAWALLAVLAGPVACASSRSKAGDAASASMYPESAPMYAATQAPAPPPPYPTVGMDPTAAMQRSSAVRTSGEPEIDVDASSSSVALAKAAPPAPGRGAPGPAQPAATSRPAPTSPAPQPGAAPAAAGPQGAQQGAAEASAAPAPLLVYTAQVAMAVFEVGASLGKVEELARDLGGFLARRDDRAITIRVPAARFDEALRRLEGLGDVLQRNVVAEDVTEEFLDLGVRIRNARAVRDRLEKLLERAAKVEESIQLERELARVTSELERLEGRLKFLRDRVAFSTLTVSFQPRSTETITPSGPRLPIDWLNELGLSRLLNL
ncbi:MULTISPECIES: DUF4349 domain-containing protein [Sorangium]|uniref:DUF4349 domain-containing protein n=1 Tax=Sorangium cellulosum TaxID=56 RepID=A0A4P2QIQ0_SORCE|nr:MULTISPECIES: DUF4349 domain-containing protein [Sorangium]AUX29508.1 uncharacterized protein SOCE836_015980 [Sorangium cellulosum]WCQ88904.1 hypothetical protein NQZ70_01586 [Sorangium sp. Soce836]